MQAEFGGYLPLELAQGREYFEKYSDAKIMRLNCGRTAIVAAMQHIKPSKVHIPYYNCNVVREALQTFGIPFEYYFLDEELNPVVTRIGENEWLLYVNYFGNCTKAQLQYIKDKFKRVIFDNTQAFFADPILEEDTFNAYSCRKFVGVPDGSYLVWGGKRQIDTVYPQDVSWERSAFLLKSLELGTNAAYQDNLCSKADFGEEVKGMSVLTRKMLASFDYDKIREIRYRNFQILHQQLKEINQFPYLFETDTMFVYPLYSEILDLREKLVEQKIYVSQWWKYLLDIVPEDSIEAKMSKWILPLPIDQRYSEEDMMQLADIVKKCYAECLEKE